MDLERVISFGVRGVMDLMSFVAILHQFDSHPLSIRFHTYAHVAIRFVLGDAYTNMTREERQSLLHEGTGPTTLSAFVEIIFDNAENRFPTGRSELTLRRTIGQKKDEYSLDKKSIT